MHSPARALLAAALSVTAVLAAVSPASAAQATTSIAASRVSGPCIPTATFKAVVTANGTPLVTQRVDWVITPPASTGLAPTIGSSTTNAAGEASYSIVLRSGYTITPKVTATTKVTAASAATMPLDPDKCVIEQRVTTVPPAQLAYGDPLVIGGVAEAVRDDGARTPLPKGTVSVQQVDTGSSVARNLGEAPVAADGSWTLSTTARAAGVVQVSTTTLERSVNPASVDYPVTWPVSVLKHTGALSVAATATTSPIVAGLTPVSVAGRLTATHPLTGGPTPDANLRGLPVSVAFTPLGAVASRIVASTSTTSTADYTTTVRPPSNGKYTASLGTNKGVVATPASTNVSVASRVVLSSTPTYVLAGANMLEATQVYPRLTGQRVTIEHRLAGTSAWLPFATVPTGRTYLPAPAVAGVYEFRSSYAGSYLAGPGVSAVRTVTVKPGTVVLRPRGLDCVSTSGQLPVCTWEALAGATSYTLYKGTTVVGTSATNTLTTTGGFSVGVPASVTLKATVSGKLTAASTPDDTVVLATPTGLTQTASGPGTASLTWNAVTAADGYDIYVNDRYTGDSDVPSVDLGNLRTGDVVTVVAATIGGDTSAPASLAVTVLPIETLEVDPGTGGTTDPGTGGTTDPGTGGTTDPGTGGTTDPGTGGTTDPGTGGTTDPGTGGTTDPGTGGTTDPGTGGTTDPGTGGTTDPGTGGTTEEEDEADEDFPHDTWADSSRGKIGICHATGSTKKPYVRQILPVTAVIASRINGKGVTAGDIIPPFSLNAKGTIVAYNPSAYPNASYQQNWNADTEAIHANGCVQPK